MTTRTYRRSPLAAAILLAALALAATSAQARRLPRTLANTARVSFVNAAAGAPPLSVRFGTRTLARRLAYTRTTRPKLIFTGGYPVSIAATGSNATLFETTAPILRGHDYTVVVTIPPNSLGAGQSPPILPYLVDVTRREVPADRAHVVFSNASPDVQNVSLVLDGAEVTTGTTFATGIGPIETSTGNRVVEVRSGGQTILGPTNFAFKGATKYTFTFHGTASTLDSAELGLIVQKARNGR